MKKSVLLALASCLALNTFADDKTIGLAGRWDFGFGDNKVYNDIINLPGSMLTNGKGNDVDADTKWTGSLYDLSYYYSDAMAQYREKGNIKFPFFLTPDKEYVGNAYYRRNVEIPSAWKGSRVVLHLERPHIETTLFVNGKEVGHQMSLSTPHEYDVTSFIRPGKNNTIEVRVYNGVENVNVGSDSHSVSDQTQGNWNGIAGDIYLKAGPKDSYIRNVRVYPDAAARKANVQVIRGGKSVNISNASVTAVSDDGADVFSAASPSVSGDTLSFVIDMGDKMKLWDEFSTPLYHLTAVLDGDHGLQRHLVCAIYRSKGAT